MSSLELMKISSLEIAELTGKRHDNVMRDIKSLIGQDAIDILSLKLVSYMDSCGETHLMFELSHDATDYLLTKYKYVLSQGLYLLECKGFYKIGITSNVVKRVETLQMGNPFIIKIIMFRPMIHAKRVEHELHRRYAGYNVSGEWFRLTDNEVSEIITIGELK